MRGPLPVVLATGNAGKAREFGRLLDPTFAVHALPGSVTLPPETGQTFAANARLKAEAVYAALQGTMAVLADDSGLEVAALGGRPGVQSARFAGEGAGDAENVSKLLREMDGRCEREARFVCSLCLIMPEDPGSGGTPRVIEVEGCSAGEVTLAPRGTDGFGYDPVFRPDGWHTTLAEASPAEKDSVSHRGAAARALIERVARIAEGGSGGPVPHGS